MFAEFLLNRSGKKPSCIAWLITVISNATATPLPAPFGRTESSCSALMLTASRIAIPMWTSWSFCRGQDGAPAGPRWRSGAKYLLGFR